MLRLFNYTIMMAFIMATTAPCIAKGGYTLGRAGISKVFIWRDHAAFKEAIALMQAGIHEKNPALIMPLLACIVPAGTTAVAIDPGMFSSTVLVTSGPRAGCRGFVTNEDLAD
ncbi:hypothetical protein [Xanthobacter agilis]|jgi:hypothetical protein|uniref:hypothetical protein n=1 Tax=Xanthobacter agilis TaxID=47492 RepID=UPI0037263CFF